MFSSEKKGEILSTRWKSSLLGRFHINKYNLYLLQFRIVLNPAHLSRLIHVPQDAKTLFLPNHLAHRSIAILLSRRDSLRDDVRLVPDAPAALNRLLNDLVHLQALAVQELVAVPLHLELLRPDRREGDRDRRLLPLDPDARRGLLRLEAVVEGRLVRAGHRHAGGDDSHGRLLARLLLRYDDGVHVIHFTLDAPDGHRVGVDDLGGCLRIRQRVERNVHPRQGIDSHIEQGARPGFLVQESRRSRHIRGVDWEGELSIDASDGADLGQELLLQVLHCREVARPHGLHQHHILLLGELGENLVLLAVHGGWLLNENVPLVVERNTDMLVMKWVWCRDVYDVEVPGLKHLLPRVVDLHRCGIGNLVLCQPVLDSLIGASRRDGNNLVLDRF